MSQIKEITVVSGQNIYDIALQYYGDISMIWKIIEDNDLSNGIDTVLSSGQKLFIDDLKVVNNDLKGYLTITGIATEPNNI